MFKNICICNHALNKTKMGEKVKKIEDKIWPNTRIIRILEKEKAKMERENHEK